MDSTQPTSDFIGRYCFLFLGSLVLLSIVFYLERTVFLDNSLQTYLLIHRENITIMAGRWPSTLIRVLPLAAVYCHLPLKVILLLFSMSYALFQFGIGTLVYKYILDKRYFVFFCITIAVITGHSFFWCVSELLQAVSVSILVLGLVLQALELEQYRRAYILQLLGSILLVFYHPQSILCLVFGQAYLFGFRKLLSKRILFPLIASACFVLKSIFVKNWYDTMKFKNLKANLESMWPNYFDSPTNLSFAKWLSTDLALYSVVFCVVIGFLLYKREWFRLLLVIGFSVLYLFLFHTTNAEGMQDFYAEAGYMPMSFFVALPLIFTILRSSQYRAICSVFILCCCLLKIGFVSRDYSGRLAYLQQLITLAESPKIIQKNTYFDQEILKMDWGLPFETLILSTILDKNSPKTLVSSTYKDEYIKFLDGQKFINGMGGAFDYNGKQVYFSLDSNDYILGIE